MVKISITAVIIHYFVATGAIYLHFSGQCLRSLPPFAYFWQADVFSSSPAVSAGTCKCHARRLADCRSVLNVRQIEVLCSMDTLVL